MVEAYKNIFIGFGKAAKTLANSLASQNEEVLMIEASDQMYGGTCINIACLPTKHLKNQAELGVSFEEAVQKKNQMTAALRQGNYNTLANKETAKVWTGQASFIDNHTLAVQMADGSQRQVQGERIFINTGAIANRLNVPGEDLDTVLNSTEILALDQLPQKLAIIGAGYIALEFAGIFNQFGADVTIINHNDAFLSREEADVAQMVFEDMQADGIRYIPNAATQSFELANDQTIINYDKDGQQHQLAVDKVLVAVGRHPNTEGLNLSATDIQLGDRGEVLVDDYLKTSVDNIWAMGDVKGGPQFTYISLDDSRIIADQLLSVNNERTTKNRQHVPYTLYLNPPLSRVGMTEKEAKEARYNIKVFEQKATTIPKAKVLDNTRGLFKVIVDQDTNLILGASIYAAASHEVINLVTLAMNQDLPYTVLKDQIYTHPTMAETFNSLF